MHKPYGTYFLIIAATIAILTAVAHISCIVLGPQCFSYQMAPALIVESAEKGTLLAPLGTIIISGIFILWALYACSGAELIRKLPLLNVGIYAIAALCIIRGLLGIQLWARHPELLNTFATLSNFVWLITGLLFLFGFRSVKSQSSKNT